MKETVNDVNVVVEIIRDD